MESLFEQLGGTYTRQGDYCLPEVCLPPEEERPIGIYGQRRRVYLKKHHRVLYYNLLTAGTLGGHLADIEEQAQELFLRLVEQYADTEGVQQVCFTLDVPFMTFFLFRAFLFPSLHCLQPLFFKTFRTLHPSRGRIFAATSWTYPVRFVPLIFRHGPFHLLRRTLHFSGLVTGAPSARLHYGGAR